MPPKNDPPPEAAGPKRVFISYGHDRHVAVASRIKADLQARGHEVWFDADRIRPGDDWERYLEEGLHWVCQSPDGCVVLLMTPHSVRRPNGFCLNELARAIHMSLRVIPVMLVWCEPPLSICRIQWLDMMDCVPPEAHPDRYREKLARLARAVERGQADFEGFQSELIQALKPLSYDAEIKYNLERFTGRRWVFDEIDRWMKEGRSRVFWILGSPGVGKTAMSACLCSQRREIAAFHFCRYDNVQKMDPRCCIMSLAYQLSTQLPDYEEHLKRLKLGELGSLNARTLFDLLIAQPLAAIPDPGRPVVMLIDALDEATAMGRNELASFIASELDRTPDWLKLIITSRPDPEVMGPLQAYTPYVFDISDPRNAKDIRAYLKRELKQLCGGEEAPAAAVEAITTKSEGMFLYAEWIVRDLARGLLSLDRPDEFPQGLGGIYLQFFERQFPDVARWDAEVRPALEVVAALQEPQGVRALGAIFGWSVHDERRFRRSVGSLFQFDRDAANPFHKSVIEWLTDEDKHDPYFIDVLDGHRKLADRGLKAYRQGRDAWTPYLLAYLPIHLCMAGRQADLEPLLRDLAFVRAAWERDRFAVLKQWSAIEAQSPLHMEDVYRPTLEGLAGENDKDLAVLADLLKDTYHFADALKILDCLVGRYRQTGDRHGLQGAIGDQAGIYLSLCEYDRAMELLKEQERICREVGDMNGLQSSIRNQAEILGSRNDMDAAMVLLKEQERICREIGNKDGLLESLTDQAFILRFRGDYDGVLKLVGEQERLFVETGNKFGIQKCLGEYGAIRWNRGDLDVAMGYFKEEEKMCREIGNKDYLRFALAGQQVILSWQGDLEAGLALNAETERLARAIRSNYALQECMGDQTFIRLRRGELDAAEALVAEREVICAEIGNRYGIQWCHNHKGRIFLAKGKPEEALAEFREQEQICREIGHRRDLAVSLGCQAAARRERGDLPAAVALHDEALALLRQIGYQYGLQEALGQKALTLARAGDRAGALALLAEQEQICRKMGLKLDLQECLRNKKAIGDG